MQSHPAWVRGLKRRTSAITRTPVFVAPRVGAWIETNLALDFKNCSQSHPAWVRGLKRY